ncbi:MAG: SDR family oxidoreductase [Candidatus Omnitrophica bacterium]|nr:SDR family oxidoreductase [Candidatus Omnitrophota bacterium]
MNRILVTGATGYIGGRLIPLLLERGYAVRAMARSRSKLQDRLWAQDPRVQLVEADIFNLESLKAAVTGCEAAFYLVHSMLPGQKDFCAADKLAAENMKLAAAACGIKRLVYLGGLGEEGPGLSQHLQSRAEVARILNSGTVPVTILRAAMIIGAGSASFEILRYLVDRLPIMVTPRWLKTLNQPIAVSNVLTYLAGVLEKPETAGETYDIGGPDILTYHQLMDLYAEEAGLPHRMVVPVPVLTPRLSSYWIHLVTPVPASLARPLAEGLKNPVVCRETRIRQIIPQELLSCREAIRGALSRLKDDEIQSHWTDAGVLPCVASIDAGDPAWAGGTVFSDRRTLPVKASAIHLWRVLETLGGKTGWFHADWLWGLRGVLDRMIGGVGLRRGRRSQQQLRVGDALDFWRVSFLDKPRVMILLAEMKLPGKALLQFKITEENPGLCRLDMTARFWPRGLGGILYWYFVMPFHAYVFSGMLRQIAVRAEKYSRPV